MSFLGRYSTTVMLRSVFGETMFFFSRLTFCISVDDDDAAAAGREDRASGDEPNDVSGLRCNVFKLVSVRRVFDFLEWRSVSPSLSLPLAPSLPILLSFRVGDTLL